MTVILAESVNKLVFLSGCACVEHPYSKTGRSTWRGRSISGIRQACYSRRLRRHNPPSPSRPQAKVESDAGSGTQWVLVHILTLTAES